MESWLDSHMGGVLLVIEILWVAGVIAVFGFYFYMKYRVNKKKRQLNIGEDQSGNG